MMWMRRLHRLTGLFFVLPAISVLLSAGEEPIQWEEEEFKVYAAIIDERIEGELVVIEGTTAKLAVEPWIPRLPDKWRQFLTHDLLDDWAMKNRESHRLSQAIPLSRDYVLLSEEELERIFQEGEGWNEFYRRYSKSNGLISLSRVAFSKKRDVALVYLWHGVRYMASSGSVFLLRKEAGRWVVRGKKTILLS